jgi:hypothetical protein
MGGKFRKAASGIVFHSFLPDYQGLAQKKPGWPPLPRRRQPNRNKIDGQTTFFSLWRAFSAIEVAVPETAALALIRIIK